MVAFLVAMMVALCAGEDEGQPPGEAAPAPDPPGGAAPDQERRLIEEIVVTAQKKEELVQEVPISITVLSGEFIKDAAIGGVHELVRFTPNVHFAESPCCSPVFIRGFGSPFTAGAFDPTVSFVVDELSIPKDIYLSDPLYDIERFEVLRGPQGILFGKNTPAGLFNVTTGQPTGEFSGYLIGRIGDLGVHRAEAAIGGPLGPLGNVAQFRLAVLDSERPGDVENTKRGEKEPGTKQRAARLRLALRPLRDVEILLTGSRAETDAVRTFPFQQNGLRDSSVDFLRQYDPKFEDDGLNHSNSQDLSGRMLRDTDYLQGNVRYSPGSLGALRDVEFVAVLGDTGFDGDAPIDNDFSPAAILEIPSPVPFRYDQRSVELRASAFAPAPFVPGELELLVGFLAFESSYLTDLNLTAGEDFEEWLLSPPGFEMVTGQPPPGGSGFGDLASALAALGADSSPIPPTLTGDGFRGFSDQSSSSQGIFGQAAWHLSEHWTFSAGARVTFEKKDAFLLFDCFDPGVLCAAFGSQDFTLDLDRRETDVSPKFTIQYFPFDNLALFATRAKGFKSGGFNNVITSAEGVEVDEEETVSWEAGAKGTLFDGALFYGGTFFNMDVENLQVQQFLGGATVVVRNAEGARSRGFEVDFRWLTPWEPFTLRGAGAIIDAAFKDFPDAPAPRSSGATEQDLSGERMPFVSERQLSLTPELRFPVPARGLPLVGRFFSDDPTLSLALDIHYRSDLFLDIDLDPGTHQDAYTLVTGRLGLATMDEALSLRIHVENLTDSDLLQLATDSPVFREGFMVYQEFQRQVAFELRYAW